MPIPSRTVLAAQMHCLSTDGLVVITAQHWSDPHPPGAQACSWLRLIRNGRTRQESRFSGERRQREMRAFWADLQERYAPTALDDEQMWRELRKLTGIEQQHCARRDCGAFLPIGQMICADCGRDTRRVATGSLSGTRRRGELFLPPRLPLSDRSQ